MSQQADCVGLDTGGWEDVVGEAWGVLTVSVFSGKRGAGTSAESEDGGRGVGGLRIEAQGLINLSVWYRK